MSSSSIKVLHVSSALGWRGGERQAMLLVENLNKHHPETQNFLYCSRGSAIEKKAIQKNFSFQSNKKLFPSNPFYSIGLKNYAQENNIDIIHTHDAHAHSFAYNCKYFSYQPNIVASRRVDVPIQKQKSSQRKYLSPSVKKVICVSKKIKEICDASCPGLEHKSVTVHSGIDLSLASKHQKSGWLKEKLKLPSNSVLIGNIAALVEHKDYPCFLRAAQLILKSVQTAHFVILGEGPLRNELEKLCVELKIQKHVSFLGHQNDVYRHLVEFDQFLFSSKTEGLGSSILDAFAAQVPVVACNGGGIAELVQHQKTGLLSEVGNHKKLSENSVLLLKKPKERDSLVKGALAILPQFSSQETARKTFQIYQEASKGLYF